MYKASFKINNSKNIEGKKCVLPISVGQPYHEGEKLLATINLINKSQLAHCSVVVADSLQKHNFISDQSPYETSMLLGDNWLQRNKNILDTLSIPHQIIRWDLWLQHTEYPKYRYALEREYNSNPNYRHAFDESINQFIQRKVASNEEIDHISQKKIFNSGLQYFLEECAVAVCVWEEEGYNYVMYPQVRPRALSMTYEIFSKNAHPDRIWLQFRFRQHGNSK